MSVARRFVCIFFLCAGPIWNSVSAQSESSSHEAVIQLAAEASLKAKLAETRDLLEQGKDGDADARIAQELQGNQQSVEGHQAQAMDFLRIAFAAQESGNSSLAQKAARHALIQLSKAESLSHDPDTLSSISELRGVIRERLLGTTEQAIAEYKKALERKADSPSVRQKLNLLEKSSSFEKTTTQK